MAPLSVILCAAALAADVDGAVEPPPTEAIAIAIELPAAFDAARLRALLTQRLADDPLIDPACAAPLVVTAEEGALVVRVVDGAATIPPADVGVMELELLRRAAELVRTACPARTPPAVPAVPAAPAAPAAVATDGEDAPARGVLPVVGVVGDDVLDAPVTPFVAENRIGVTVGGLGRNAIDTAAVVDVTRSFTEMAPVALEGMAAVGAVMSTGVDVVAVETLLGVGPGASMSIFGGRGRVAAVVGGRLQTWVGTRPDLPGGTRGDLVLLVPFSWTREVAGWSVGALIAPVFSQAERELRLFDAVVWQRGAAGVLFGIQIGSGEGNKQGPGA